MARTASKKLPPGASSLLRNLDAHQAHSEKLFHQTGRELLFVVHLADQRGDGLLGKLADG